MVAFDVLLATRCPNLGFGASRHCQHQRVESCDERSWVRELPTFGQQSLVKENMTPVGESVIVSFLF